MGIAQEAMAIMWLLYRITVPYLTTTLQIWYARSKNFQLSNETF